MNFNVAFERVIGHEGGYVNNPKDPGGETRFGISKRAYPDVDIKNLTLDKAKAIYRRDYWERIKATEYDGSIGFQMFDAAVNHGVKAANKMLQRAVAVSDDGIIGPRTLAAVDDMTPFSVVMLFNRERIKFYTGLSTWRTFGAGWSNRIAHNLKYAAEDLS